MVEPTAPTPTPPPPPASPPGAAGARAPRRLAAGRGAKWWSEGWSIFRAAPLPWLGIVIVLALIHFALAFIPLLGGIASTVLMPVLFGGMLLGCHGLARGRPLTVMQLFAAFGTDRLAPLAILGAIAFGVGLVIGAIAAMLMFGGAAIGMLSGATASMSAPHWGAMTMGFGVMGLVGLVVALAGFTLFAMAYWFAPALVTLDRVDPIEALKASFGASIANLGALAVFGLIGIVLAIVASIPFGLGWLVLLPMGIGAAYASWREVYGD